MFLAFGSKSVKSTNEDSKTLEADIVAGKDVKMPPASEVIVPMQ